MIKKRSRAFFEYATAQKVKKMEATFAQRFWDRVSVGEPDKCWLWKRGVDAWGYGRCGRNRIHAMCHRVSWEMTHGEIPEGMKVLHRCDNPPCVNPRHLFLGTDLDNVRDMIAKGRKVVRRGSENGNAKLSEKDIPKIFELRFKKHKSLREIAQRFSVHISTIQPIISGKGWKHIRNLRQKCAPKA